jgi:REP element-mobilizing transposase RayT
VDFLKTREIAYALDVDMPDIECDKDYFYVLFKSAPLLNIPQFVNAIKTITSGKIQRKFPEVKHHKDV